MRRRSPAACMKKMRVLVAPDKFKGSLTAPQAARAVVRGFSDAWPQAELIPCPLADGGEGTMDALVEATSGKKVTCEVTGPLGERRQAELGILGNGTTAVVEMAQASGLELIAPEKRSPRLTTTRGTGDLIRRALDMGIREIIVAIGGSATNDGGTGMAAALGARFLDSEGRELPDGGGYLGELYEVDLSGLDSPIGEARVIVACDVTNRLLGDEGASRIFAPQKGASPEDVETLEACMARLSEVCGACLACDPAAEAGAGAAGGLGYGLMTFLGAEIRPGIDVVMEYTGFQGLLEGCDLVITGEGRLDAQTAYGKTVVGVGRAAAAWGVPAVALAGDLEAGTQALHRLGISCALSIAPGPINLDESKRRAGELLETSARELAYLLKSLNREGGRSA
jgi:glycerate 2-kinase